MGDQTRTLVRKGISTNQAPGRRELAHGRDYVKVNGQWKYLYRAVDKEGNTIDFLLRAHRDKVAARRYFDKAIAQNGAPETVTIDKSGSNLAALQALNTERATPIRI